MELINSEVRIKLQQFINENYVRQENPTELLIPEFLKQVKREADRREEPQATVSKFQRVVHTDAEEMDNRREEGIFRKEKGQDFIGSRVAYAVASELPLKDYKPNALAERVTLYMAERDITTAEIRKRCCIDRKLISKITSQKNYHPTKRTMLALCIGLRLSKPESDELLNLAGYSFSNASKFDLIIRFMVEQGIYDIDQINELLYENGENCIGA